MKSLKKIISLVLAIALLASMSCVLSSCDFIFGGDSGDNTQNGGNEQHEHTFAAEWSNDAENHWHNSTCEHTDEKADLAAHKDGDKDNLCDACGYTMKVVEPSKPSVPVVTYIVDVTDTAGNPVSGVKIILVGENGYTSVKTTNARGRVSFEIEEGEWQIALAEAVEGYSNTVDARYQFTNRKATVVLR